MNSSKDDLKKFADFLKQFKENPKRYKKILIETYFTGSDSSVEQKYGNDLVIEEFKDFILNAMTQLAKYEIIYWNEDPSYIYFHFNSHFNSIADKVSVWLTCYKNQG